MMVPSLLTVALSFHAAPRAPRAHAVRLRSEPITMIKELDKKSWCEHVDGAENLAVVFFFATWCRSCRAVGPVYKRIAKEYPAADFYRVNFKAESELCYQQRVFSFPVVHFYLPGIGRVGRLVLKKSEDPEGKLRAQLQRFVGGPDGPPPAQLQLLRQLRAEALSPVVRYTELVSALSGLADMGGQQETKSSLKLAGLAEAIDNDEQRLAELEATFGWLDRDQTGRISLSALEETVRLLRPQQGVATQMAGGEGAAAVEGEGMAASEALTPLPTTVLLERIRDGSSGAGAEVSVDLATFTRLMTSKAVADYLSPDRALLPTFEAIDLNGDGKISQDEFLATIQNFCMQVPGADGCDLDQRDLLPRAFDAFANDEQLLDYERFVEMVSGREPPLECELDDAAEYGSIFGPDL